MGALNWNPEITQNNQRLHSQPKQVQPIFPLVSASELTAQPIKVEWLLQNILEQNSLNLLFGEPGAGKSLFALDWAFCIAAGLDWAGQRTKQADVVVIAGEGFSGIARRLKALEQKYSMQSPERLFISKQPADFLDGQNIQCVADSVKATCPNPGLVIIDTMHRNMAGDENSSQDIGQFINNIDLYLKPLGAATLIVHHSGHGQKERSRGSSSIRAAMDAEFCALKADSGITLTCHKAKDFEALKPLKFDLKVAELDWLDDDDEPLKSVFLEYAGEARPDSKERKLSARDDAILTSLGDAIAINGVAPTAEIKAKFGGFDSLIGRLQKVVRIDYWREQAYKTIAVDCDSEEKKQEARKKAFKRTRDKLFNGGFIIEYGDYAWRVYE